MRVLGLSASFICLCRGSAAEQQLPACRMGADRRQYEEDPSPNAFPITPVTWDGEPAVVHGPTGALEAALVRLRWATDEERLTERTRFVIDTGTSQLEVARGLTGAWAGCRRIFASEWPSETVGDVVRNGGHFSAILRAQQPGHREYRIFAVEGPEGLRRGPASPAAALALRPWALTPVWVQAGRGTFPKGSSAEIPRPRDSSGVAFWTSELVAAGGPEIRKGKGSAKIPYPSPEVLLMPTLLEEARGVSRGYGDRGLRSSLGSGPADARKPEKAVPAPDDAGAKGELIPAAGATAELKSVPDGTGKSTERISHGSQRGAPSINPLHDDPSLRDLVVQMSVQRDVPNDSPDRVDPDSSSSTKLKSSSLQHFLDYLDYQSSIQIAFMLALIAVIFFLTFRIFCFSPPAC